MTADLTLSRRSRTIGILTLPAIVILVGGCEQSNQYVEPPPPEVTIMNPIRRAVTSYLEYTGTTGAVETSRSAGEGPRFPQEKAVQGGQ